MGVSYLNSSNLIASIVRRTLLPESQVTYSNDDLLAFANEEMMVGIVPSVLKMHEEFYVYPFGIPMEANESFYEIPDRAIGSKVKVVFYQDASTNIQEMARIDPSNLAWYQNRSSINFPRAFYLENNYMVMVPIISDSPQGNLIAKIFLRPNQLVTVDQSANVISCNPTTGVVVFDGLPSDFALVDANGLPILYDFTQQTHGHRLKGMNLAALSLNATTNTMVFPPALPLPVNANIPNPLNLGVPLDLVPGDVVCFSNQTTIPQCPDELHPILAQRVACRILEGLKDSEGLQNANNKLVEMEINLGMLIDNRTEGMPQKVNNVRSALRSGKFRRRRSTY